MAAICIFCSIDERIFENELAYAIYDKYPVNEGHMLVIPKRHMASFFAATEEEKRAIMDLLGVCQEHISEKYRPDGFNIGINEGEAAGQTIMHLHVHLIPRYKRDVEEPRGGVRGVVPGKRDYPKRET